MTDEEFISQAIKILNTRGCTAVVCSTKDTLYLGGYSYMRRFQLVGAAEEILKLEGFTIIKEVKR